MGKLIQLATHSRVEASHMTHGQSQSNLLLLRHQSGA